jgi:dihydroorotase
MRRIVEYLAPLDRVLMVHCEDKALTKGASMNEGRVSSTLGLTGMPALAEEEMVARNIALSEMAGARLHICHISTRGAVEIVRRARAQGARVTAEACPHHFAITDEAVIGYNTDAKMNPPLRAAEDVEAVRQGLVDGTVDCIATDHAPHAREEKEQPFADAPFGIVGLETALGLTLKELVQPGLLTLNEAVAKLTIEPVAVLTGDTVPLEELGVSWGTLSVGAPADVTVLAPGEVWTLAKGDIYSKSKTTPFIGAEFKGRVRMTVRDGAVIYDREAEGASTD